MESSEQIGTMSLPTDDYKEVLVTDKDKETVHLINNLKRNHQIVYYRHGMQKFRGIDGSIQERPAITRKIFTPGFNKITLAEFKILSAHPHGTHLFKKVLKFPEGQHPILNQAKPQKDLSGFPNADAVEVVTQTANVDLLKEWLGTEKRRDVQKALETRIDAIEKPDEE